MLPLPLFLCISLSLSSSLSFSLYLSFSLFLSLLLSIFLSLPFFLSLYIYPFLPLLLLSLSLPLPPSVFSISSPKSTDHIQPTWINSLVAYLRNHYIIFLIAWEIWDNVRNDNVWTMNSTFRQLVKKKLYSQICLNWCAMTTYFIILIYLWNSRLITLVMWALRLIVIPWWMDEQTAWKAGWSVQPK